MSSVLFVEPEARPSFKVILPRLIIASVFFFALYSGTNWLTSLRADVGSYVFDWERYIPFIPASIVPYWSLDLLFAAGFFVCQSKRELTVYFRRMVLSNVLAPLGFLLFPLHFSFVRPPVEGVYGFLFDVLLGFDKPFNQAPSLHIILTLVVWQQFLPHIRSAFWRACWHSWCALIALSILTTYQHHFIDLITGFWAGIVVLYWVPDKPWASYAVCIARPAWKIARYYLAGGLLCLGIALVLRGLFWWLLWPMASLWLVASAYLGLGARIFQKTDGRQSLAATVLLAPYRRFSSRVMHWNCRHLPPVSHVAGQVWLGHWPFRQGALPKDCHIVDVCAEFNAAQNLPLAASVPMLDLVPPALPHLKLAVQRIDEASRRGPAIIVHCALGLSRSAVSVAAWLLHSGQAQSVDQAVALVRQARPEVVLKDGHIALLHLFAKDAAN